MGATLYAMERDVRAIAAGKAASSSISDALIELWYRTLYNGASRPSRRRARR